MEDNILYSLFLHGDEILDAKAKFKTLNDINNLKLVNRVIGQLFFVEETKEFYYWETKTKYVSLNIKLNNINLLGHDVVNETIDALNLKTSAFNKNTLIFWENYGFYVYKDMDNSLKYAFGIPKFANSDTIKNLNPVWLPDKNTKVIVNGEEFLLNDNKDNVKKPVETTIPTNYETGVFYKTVDGLFISPDKISLFRIDSRISKAFSVTITETSGLTNSFFEINNITQSAKNRAYFWIEDLTRNFIPVETNYYINQNNKFVFRSLIKNITLYVVIESFDDANRETYSYFTNNKGNFITNNNNQKILFKSGTIKPDSMIL